MREATIRFEGQRFQAGKWNRLLRDLGFRLSGGAYVKAIYVSGGDHLIAESRGFLNRDGQQGYEWQLTLKQTRIWEGTIKFFAVQLAAFSIPQTMRITLEDRVFADIKTLRAHAQAAIVRDYELAELIDRGVYRTGDGIQFV